jgi:hypothetical protein
MPLYCATDDLFHGDGHVRPCLQCCPDAVGSGDLQVEDLDHRQPLAPTPQLDKASPIVAPTGSVP